MSQSQPSEQELFENNVTFMLQALRTGIPGKIVKTDGQKATVIPLVKRLFKGKAVEPTAIPNIPIWRLGTNKARVTVPINKQGGDYCVIMFAERPIDTWAAGDGTAKAPKDGAHHDTRGAWCLVGLEPFTSEAVNTEDLIVEMNRDKPEKYCSVIMQPTGDVTIKSPTKLVLDVPEIVMSASAGKKLLESTSLKHTHDYTDTSIADTVGGGSPPIDAIKTSEDPKQA